jgi:hypothetical protein
MPEIVRPPVMCKRTWIQDGKDHMCILERHESFQPCECDCRIRAFKKHPQAPLRLAHWKRGKKKVSR